MKKKKTWIKVNPYVFFSSAVIAVLFVIIAGCFTETVKKFFTHLQEFITSNFGWFYILSVAFFLFFVIWLLCSPFGKIKLGKDHEEPEFSLFTWFAMLFSAGMGIGLVFFSVAEPLLIYSNPPGDCKPETVNAAIEAMKYSFFHWGLHAWGIYIIIGLSLAYFAYRHNLPLTIRSTLYPLLGERIYGFWGNIVEIMAVLGTLFGVATSLGLGVMQIATGLDFLNLLTDTTGHQIILIIIITLAATLSVVSGVGKGIRRLSELNLFLALLLMLFVCFAGPTAFLLRAFAQNIGNYLESFMFITFRTGIFQGRSFQRDWTLFFWGWWIAWSPFVGMFIARVSRGRTIREFIAGVLLAPTIITFIWFTVLGDTALHMELFGRAEMVEAVKNNHSTAIFMMLQNLPLEWVTCTLTIFVVAFFFVTSSDSASLVIDLLTSGAKKNPPIWQKVFWATSEGLIAIALLLTGGLVALQTAVITSALPFCVIICFICYSLLKALKTETELKKAGYNTERNDVLLSKNAIAVPGTAPVDTPISETFDIEGNNTLANINMKDEISEAMGKEEHAKDWRSRLKRLEKKHDREYLRDVMEQSSAENAGRVDKELQEFISKVVKPAFSEIEQELVKYDRKVKISISHHQASIIVMKNNIEELYYGIRGRAYHKFSYSFPSFKATDVEVAAYAQVVLRGGSRKLHELKKFTKKGIIHDFLNEYEKWAILS